ncbi:MAG: hypothetical protein RR201_02390 [Malacoplasma sp.]
MRIKFLIGSIISNFNSAMIYYRQKGYLDKISHGKNSFISGSNSIAYPENISIGSNSYINWG